MSVQPGSVPGRCWKNEQKARKSGLGDAPYMERLLGGRGACHTSSVCGKREFTPRRFGRRLARAEIAAEATILGFVAAGLGQAHA